MKYKKGARKVFKCGFTVMELLVAISVLAVLTALSIVSYKSLNDSYKHLDVKSTFQHDLQRAQFLAIKEGCRGILSFSSDSYSFGCDYLAHDSNIPPSPDTNLFVRNLPSYISGSSDNIIIFDYQGRVVDVYGIYDSRTVEFFDSSSGSPVKFTEGSLLMTGVFSYAD